MNNMKIQSARKATHTWLAGKIKCGNCGYALMSIFNPSGKQYLRCCFDAMHKRTSAVSRPKCQKPLSDYKLVILGTPVWAGRCSSVIRGFLKRRGYEIQNAAYLITHKSEQDYKDVFRQMDLYLQTPHVAEVSLCPDSAGYHFWRDQFVKACSDFIAEDKA